VGPEEPPEYLEGQEYSYGSSDAEMKGKPGILIDQIKAEKTGHVGCDKRAQDKDHEGPMKDPGLKVSDLDFIHHMASLTYGLFR